MALNQVLNLKRYVYYHTGAGYVDNYDNIPDGKEDDWRSIFTAARNRFGNKDGMLFAPIVDGEFVMLRAFKGESVTASAIAGDINDLAGAPLAYLNAMEKHSFSTFRKRCVRRALGAEAVRLPRKGRPRRGEDKEL